MHSSSNFLFTTSAAGFSGLLAGHLAGINIQSLHCRKLLEEPQHALVVLFIHFPNLLTEAQFHTFVQSVISSYYIIDVR